VSRFDNYKWRGLYLAHLPFFEYCMLVQTKNVRDAIAADLEFDPKHPKHSTYVQRLACNKSQVVTITFNGQLSQFQTEEESVQGSHSVTAAMQNDLAGVLLGLFVPWNQLLDLFRQYAAGYEAKRDACASIWSIVEPTISLHNRNFASNIELLRKSKEGIRIDAALRKTMKMSQDSFDCDIDDVDPTNLDLDTEEPLNSLDENFSTESLIAAYHSIAISWHKESIAAGRRIPTLLSGTSRVWFLQSEDLLPLDIFWLNTYATSGLKFFPRTTLQHWESQIKGHVKLNEIDDIGLEERVAFEVDDFDLDLGDGVLLPILSTAGSVSNLADWRSQVGESPSGTTLTLLVNEDIPLNQKQQLVVEKVLSGALAWGGHSDSVQMVGCC
jgi:hypothetical protein